MYLVHCRMRLSGKIRFKMMRIVAQASKRIGVTCLTLIFLFVVKAPAQVSVLLEEPFSNFGAMIPTGHAAVYLSRICAASPTRLRLCNEGEAGVVISRYHRIAGYDWVAIPLIPYLYAVNRPEDVPFVVNAPTVAYLRDEYRRQNLENIAPDSADGEAPAGDWTQLIGAAYDRKIYSFTIDTTVEQDEKLMAALNSRSNRSHFNLMFHNCADFARSVIDFYYPKAVRRSFLADAGLTTPKQVAKRLVDYSERHPELRFSAIVIPQVPGTIERSKPARGIFESLMKSKKYALPLFALHPIFSGAFVAAYLTGGRFNPAHYADGYYDPHGSRRLASAAASVNGVTSELFPTSSETIDARMLSLRQMPLGEAFQNK